MANRDYYFPYRIDGAEYLVRSRPGIEGYEVLVSPGTADVKVIGTVWRRRPAAGFAGKLSTGWPSADRVIECATLKDLAWWLHTHYQTYLKNVAGGAYPRGE